MDNSSPFYPHLSPVVVSAVSLVSRMLVELLVAGHFLLLIACATPVPDEVKTGTTDGFGEENGEEALSNKSHVNVTNPGTTVPVDEKSGLVAGNLVFALHQVFGQRGLPLDIIFRQPGNSFDYHLLEQLQRAGFAVYVAKPQTQGNISSAEGQLYYGIERVSRGGANAREFSDYSFQLQINGLRLERQYRVSTESIKPLSPMVLAFAPQDQFQENQLQQSSGQNQVAGKVQPSRYASERVLLQTDDSLFFN